LQSIVEATKKVSVIAVVGLPLRLDHRLFNCAAVVYKGRVLGVVPKTYLPNYSEFYEARQFNAADTALSREIRLGAMAVPFGNDLLFEASNLPLFRFHAEICEDLWVPIPPSSLAALAGATVLVNLSASNITIGKSDYRHQLVAQQSARCLAAYLYASAGVGESTTDLAWDGEALICESGDLLAQSERFADGSHFITADVDLERVSRERMRQNTFGQSVARHKSELQDFRHIAFELSLPAVMPMALRREVARFPYVPADIRRRDERCAEVYHIQVSALVQRLSASGIDKVVIGISGGLDSTHALLVCARAMDLLQKPRSHILAYTMPGFATSTRTLDQARRLMQTVGCSAHEIDIRPSAERMLADIGHPYAKGRAEYDLTFENVQAGERTSHLFRLANLHGGLVVGTGDLSELALGWSTYGVGDHMSHYNVNASVPKTLVKHLVRWVASSGSVGDAARRVLDDIVATEVSPELVPGATSDKPAQSSEDVVGPYELQDFHLYQVLRYGFAPSKVAFLAWTAWHDAAQGRWPDGPEVARHEYSIGEIKKHLRNFLHRFFKTSQFKRSVAPNAPKVGSGGSLSPRGDWRAPSDSDATVWLQELDAVPDQ
jgi:NAD+ synthase (glutamine-hydrolysing)